MFRKLKTALLAPPTRPARPSSLYSTHSSTGSDSTDRDSVHSEPSDLYSNVDDDIYSPVTFGVAPYEVPLPLGGGGGKGVTEAVYDTVEYCENYDIYEEYGFDKVYEPFDHDDIQVYVVCHVFMYHGM